jgi:hypothetical protein
MRADWEEILWVLQPAKPRVLTALERLILDRAIDRTVEVIDEGFTDSGDKKHG